MENITIDHSNVEGGVYRGDPIPQGSRVAIAKELGFSGVRFVDPVAASVLEFDMTTHVSGMIKAGHVIRYRSDCNDQERFDLSEEVEDLNLVGGWKDIPDSHEPGPVAL